VLCQTPRFITYDEARDLATDQSAQAWPEWIASQDRSIRERLNAGEEDSVTNLLRFGVTFTKEYRIDDEYLAKYGESTLVQSFAEHRADDLIKALAAPPTPGIAEVRALLEQKGFSMQTAAARKRLRQHLLGNLARMRQDLLQAKEQAKGNRSQMFENRGISLDSNLWPDYDIDQHLRKMAEKDLLPPHSIRKIAIVGPGLDFVNKQEGVDFYPPQTVQPFAILDSLLRLGLADADRIQVFTLDISPRVNVHLGRARGDAAAGRPYTVQLPWPSGGRWSGDFRADFTRFWQNLGLQIGDVVDPIPVPDSVSSLEMVTRAVRIRPDCVLKVKPVDMNIVFERLPVSGTERFDLIIGTNVFVYYGTFEQSLAWLNIQAMLRPGGYLLSNDRLKDDPVLVTEIPMTSSPVITDYVFCYRTQP
jgi:hypothetical protein